MTLFQAFLSSNFFLQQSDSFPLKGVKRFFNCHQIDLNLDSILTNRSDSPADTTQVEMMRRRTPVLLQVYLPSGLFVIVSWISFIVPPEVVPGKKSQLRMRRNPFQIVSEGFSLFTINYKPESFCYHNQKCLTLFQYCSFSSLKPKENLEAKSPNRNLFIFISLALASHLRLLNIQISLQNFIGGESGWYSETNYIIVRQRVKINGPKLSRQAIKYNSPTALH